MHHGRTPYLPNAVGGGCPFLAGDEDGGYIHVPRWSTARRRGTRPRRRYTQATMFWHSMSEVEQDHIVDAYTFELGKVDVPAVVYAHDGTTCARRPASSPLGSASDSASRSRPTAPTVDVRRL